MATSKEVLVSDRIACLRGNTLIVLPGQWSSGHDESVEVNQRALIDKVLARYSGEFTGGRTTACQILRLTLASLSGTFTEL